MMEWLAERVDLLSAVSSIGMLVIWILYLQLFFLTYRKQRRPNLLIHQAGGFGLDSRCVIANMSETAVHVAALLIDVEQGDRCLTFQPLSDGEGDLGDPLSHTRQGPLTSAAYMDVGEFGVLLDAAASTAGDGFDDERGHTVLTVRGVAFVGSELFPTGASRRFEIRGRRSEGDVRPLSALPETMSYSSRRRLARRWLEEAQGLENASVVTPTAREDG